ncbi:hypothetical protein KAJ87_04340 [Candidatus Pacearchaeota archaeon]|nr:hypothetical protein [Candidatus Pacearchaeota archaeon]
MKTKRQKSGILTRLSLKSQTKAQLKIQQMAFMLMAITLFFVLAGMFVLVIKFAGLKESATLLEEENAMLLVTKLANSPEFSCGEAFGSNRINCVDFDKVMMLKENIDKYSKFWGVASIEIRKVFPKSQEICTAINYKDCGVIEVFSKDVNSLPPSSNFVSLCRKESEDGKIYDKCELAKLIVGSEDKR